MAFLRVVIFILDSVGIGALPDAGLYGDEGSNTLANTARAVGGLSLPNLAGLGLGRISPIEGVPPVLEPRGAYGKMAEKSAGKDTTTGHWEMMGLDLDKPFPLYPGGFPPEVIGSFISAIGRPVLGNKAASGTEIIEELGAEHLHTGWPIVYTSADSVFQVAAHGEVIPVEVLYQYCRAARKILAGEHAVGRVIARPFTGRPGSFRRTEGRRDFSLEPVRPTVLDALKEAGREVIGVGKIEDIFAGRGLTQAVHTAGNREGVDRSLEFMHLLGRGLLLANLIDYDSSYGHRNDPQGYARALARFDSRVPEILGALEENDLLFITADHGCDPTTPSTDHSREYVPLLVYGERVRAGLDLGTRSTFADLGKTVAEALEVGFQGPGKSFLGELVISQS